MNRENALKELLSAQRIGVVRTDRLGDMILTLPLVKALAQQAPQARVELITRRYVEDVVRHIPELAAVHFVDDMPLRTILQEYLFDVLFFPHPVLSESWEAFRAAVRLRVGSAYRWYSWMYNARIPDHRSVAHFHEAEYNVRMLDALTGNRSEVSLVQPVVQNSARIDFVDIAAKVGLDVQKPYLVVHPGSGNSAIEWSPANFAACAKHIQSVSGHQIVISGTASESQKCEELLRHCPAALNFCGKLNLAQLMALLERSALLISNSTGVLHLAAALGTAVVGLYPNSPAMSAKRWGPYTKHSRVLSPPKSVDPARNNDMSLISVQSVTDAALDLLREVRSA